MEDKLRISVTLGLGGIGLIWVTGLTVNCHCARTKGHVYMVLGLYGVALVIGLWKMYKPRGVRLPEFKADNLSMDLPDSQLGGDLAWRSGEGSMSSNTDPDVLARARQFLNLEEITDYSKAVEKYNKIRKEKKD